MYHQNQNILKAMLLVTGAMALTFFYSLVRMARLFQTASKLIVILGGLTTTHLTVPLI
jgi:hypothetical protein